MKNSHRSVRRGRMTESLRVCESDRDQYVMKERLSETVRRTVLRGSTVLFFYYAHTHNFCFRRLAVLL